MPTILQPDNGPYTRNYATNGDAPPFSATPPPNYTRHTSKRVVAVVGCPAISAYVGERRPLLPEHEPNPQPSAIRVSLLVVHSTTVLFIFLLIFLLGSLCYSVMPGPSAEVDYKSLYQGAEDEIYNLQIKLHDLRGHLTNAKVLAFWEIARTMYTNMCVPRSLPLTRLIACIRDTWVGADDPGGDPKFWSYGITNGLFNDNNPPVTSIKLHFADWQAAVVENTDQRRIVGYKVESNRSNNGWWIVTGLNEFGQGGSHEVKFGAKRAIFGGAEYEVTVFYADWKL